MSREALKMCATLQKYYGYHMEGNPDGDLLKAICEKLNECQKEKVREFNRGWNEGVFKIEQDEAIKEGRSTERGRAYIEGRFDRYKLRR